MGTMLGCCRQAPASASRRQRGRSSLPARLPARSNLKGTELLRRSPRAFLPPPHPPPPPSPTTSPFPTHLPACASTSASRGGGGGPGEPRRTFTPAKTVGSSLPSPGGAPGRGVPPSRDGPCELVPPDDMPPTPAPVRRG